ncbi:MAG: apolipoprotein N-acyltransferase [Akkermansiaceae bacterium]|nr:apolipoprotein N-acyltransferase [Akkermansiaceae bacterium]MCP5548343.1 apolipoprotein N-acyltransferase [Akkermansiaceae bacterium]
MGSRPFWLRLAAVIVSGLLVVLLFPPFHAAALVWIALVPLLGALWSLEGKRAGLAGFALGWIGGMVSNTLQFRWLAEVSWVGALVLPAYLALFWAAFGAWAATWGNPWRARRTEMVEGNSLADRLDPRRGDGGTAAIVAASLRTAFCTAAVWAGLEWLRGWLFTGFGWNGLGVAFHETPVMAQSADLLGICALAMPPLFFQAAFLQAARRVLRTARDGKRSTRLDFIAAACVVGVFVIYGILRMSTEGRGDSLRLRTLLVQLNIPQEAARMLWDSPEIHMAYEDETLKALEAIRDADEKRLKKSIEKADEGEITLRSPDWVLWPETALTGRILRAESGAWGQWTENEVTIRRVMEGGSFRLIFGVNEVEAEDHGDQLVMKEKPRFWNSIAVFSPEGELTAYQKHHLVIFGETIPFIDSLPFLRKIYEQQAGASYGGSFTPGTSFATMPVPALDGTVIETIPSVCFEDTVPRLTRKFARAAPQVIVNVTNDGWFKQSAAAAQHFANARFRAIELRRPMIRCANTGVSAAVDTLGLTRHPDTGRPQVITDHSGSTFTRGALLTELDVPLHPGATLYSVVGDAGVIVVSLVGLVVSFLTRRTPLPS